MARGKFEYWLTEDGLALIAGWTRQGLTDEQIAHNMDIAYSTFRVWKDKFPAISAAQKKNKEIVDFEVENALLKRALGYDYQEEKIEKSKDGTKVSQTLKHVPPDVTAQIFWLKNRMKRHWKDKPVEDAQTAALETAMRALADIIEKPAQNRNIEDFEE